MTKDEYKEIADDLRYMCCDRLGPARNKEVLQFAINAVKAQARLSELMAELDADEDAAAHALFRRYFVEV